MKTAAGALIVIAQLFVAIPPAPAADGCIPSVVIPVSNRPPKIDGRIEADEWADAAAITGFIQPQSGLVTPPGGVVYIKHDAEKLYFAFRSNLLPGQEPSRRYRRRDEPVYMDSNQIELWLTAPVDDAKTWAYQFIGNAYGAIFDNLQHPELGSVSMGWNGNWTFKNTYEVGKHWDAELSIAAADLGVKRIDAGQVWRGMVGIAWPQRSWPYTGGWYKNLKMHAKWIMGADAACARIENVDALLDNRLDLRLAVPGNFTATAAVGDLKRTHTGRGRCVLRADLPKSDQPRVLRLTVKAPDGRTLFDGDWKFTAGVKSQPRKPRPREKPFPAQVSYAAEAKALLARADVLDYPRRDRLAAVTVGVHPKNAPGKPVAEKKITDFRYDQAETYLWLGGKVKPGQYTVRFTFADANGKTLDANTKDFKVIDPAKEFVWYGNRVGTTYTVKPELTPIEVDGRHLRVWGRDYAFDSGVLPSQITSKGKPMLAQPISLVVERGGKTVVAEPVGSVRITEKSPTRVRFEGGYRADDLRLTLSGHLDFDGMLYYTLRTAATAKVDGLYLSTALKGEHAKYYHTTAGGWSGAMDAVPDAPADKPFWSSQRFAPFIPYVGLSDDDRCLQWFADNDHNWLPGADRPCVELWRHRDRAELRVNLVRRRGAVPAMKDVHFGLIATPVKPLPAGWRNLSLHFGALNNSKIAFFWGSGHGGGLNLHDSAGLLKKLGVAAGEGQSPDAVLAGLSGDVKGVADKLSSKAGGVIACPFHNARMYFPGYRSKAFQTFFPGDWREYPPGGWFHLAPTRSYQDFYCWYFDKWVKHLGVRGVYYDEAYFPRDYNVFNGSGKVMPDGEVRPSVNLMHLRRYMRRVRQIFVDHGVRPFIWVHTSNYMAPHALSWTQVAMFGEDRSPTPSSDYLDVAPAMIFRTIGRSQKFGIPPIWMNQVGRGGGAGPMTWLGRQVCGWCWMHDTSVELHTSPRGRPLQQLRVLWGIAAEDVTYHPYWKQRMVRTGDADFIVSVWRRPKTALLQVFNLSKDKRKTQARLTFDTAALGLGEKFEVLDLESAPELAEWKPRLAKYDAGQLTEKDVRGIGKLANADFDLSKLKSVGTAAGATVRVPPRDFALLMVRPAGGG